MQNFVFNNPVKIIFGVDVLSQIGKETASITDNILLVYGQGSIHKNGIYQNAVQSLNNHNVKISEHSGAKANPLLFHVRRGIEKAKKNQCKLVIGIGGGSVMDTAKAISAGSTVDHDVWKFFTGKKSVKDSLPVITIPTVAGSGSEINNGMVLTHDEKKLKLGFGHRKLHPKICIADPTLTFSVSPGQSVFGSIDIITHCLESYFTALPPHPPFQFRLLENICKTVIENIGVVLEEPKSYNARANLLWCASMALSGITTAGLGRISFPMHLIEHGISALYDIPHGAGLSAILPGWLHYHKDLLSEKLVELGKNVFDINPTPTFPDNLCTITSLVNFLHSLNAPTCLKEIGITRFHFPEIIEHCLFQAKIWRFKDYDQTILYEILSHCQLPIEE